MENEWNKTGPGEIPGPVPSLHFTGSAALQVSRQADSGHTGRIQFDTIVVMGIVSPDRNVHAFVVVEGDGRIPVDGKLPVDGAERGFRLVDSFRGGDVEGSLKTDLKEFLTQVAIIADQSPPKVRLPQGLVLPIAYLAEAWSRLTGRGEPLITVDGVKLSKKKMFFSSERAERELGYRPGPVEEALRNAVAWFQQNNYLR